MFIWTERNFSKKNRGKKENEHKNIFIGFLAQKKKKKKKKEK